MSVPGRELDREPEQRDASAVVLDHAPPRGQESPAARVLALQRTIGNRAVNDLIGGGAAIEAGARQLSREPTQIKKGLQEQRIAGKGVYGWTAAFQVDYVGNECVLTVKVRLKPNADVTQAEIDTVKADTEAAFLRFWDEKFYLDDTKSNERFFLRAKLEWVTTGQHVTVKLIKGKGRANQTTWYSDGKPESRAHELSHTLGLLDEYIDETAVNRKTATSSGVFQDHSIMGNYYAEGTDVAEVKLRHGQAIAKLIGKASKRTFTVGYTGPYQGERLVRWRGIRDTAKTAGDAAAETAANAEISAIESDMMIPALAP
jgi:hypothetical protein